MNDAKDSRNSKDASTKSRSHYVANLKTSLTALVICHHTALAYGGLGSTIFKSGLIRPASSTALVGFNAFNQSFFMASFMHISGHYSAKSLQRKPTLDFVRDRLCRLGLPSVIYTFCIHPMSYFIVAAAKGKQYGLQDLTSYWSFLRGPRGPAWFTTTLLAFDLAFALHRYLADGGKISPDGSDTLQDEQPTAREPFNLITGLSIFTAIDFLIRTQFPLESSATYFHPLGVKLGYLFQYIAAYLLGVRASSILDVVLTGAEFIGLFGTPLCSTAVIARSDGGFQNAVTLNQMGGGFNRLAVAYSIWNNFTGYLVGSSLLGLFSRHLNKPWGCANDVAYQAFLIHMPLSTLIEVLAEGWHASHLAKFAVAGSLNVVVSWAGAWASGKICSTLMFYLFENQVNVSRTRS